MTDKIREEERRLIRFTIGEIADSLHELEQRLFYQVEAKMCEGGKVKPEFDPSTVSMIHNAKQDMSRAQERLVRATMRRL